MDAEAGHVVRGQRARRCRRRGPRLERFRGRGNDGLIEKTLDGGDRILGACGPRKSACDEAGRTSLLDPPRQRARAHSNTFMSFKISALNATFWRRAWVRFTRSLLLPDTESKP